MSPSIFGQMQFLLPHIFWIGCPLVFLKVSLLLRCSFLAKIPSLFPQESLVVFLLFIITVQIVTTWSSCSQVHLSWLFSYSERISVLQPYLTQTLCLFWCDIIWGCPILFSKKRTIIETYTLYACYPYTFSLFLLLLLSLGFMFVDDIRVFL